MRFISSLLFCLALGINLGYARTKYLLVEVDGTADGNHTNVSDVKKDVRCESFNLERKVCPLGGKMKHYPKVKQYLPGSRDCVPGASFWVGADKTQMWVDGDCRAVFTVLLYDLNSGGPFECFQCIYILLGVIGKCRSAPNIELCILERLIRNPICNDCICDIVKMIPDYIIPQSVKDAICKKTKTPRGKRSGEQPGGIISLGENEGVSSREENGGLSSSEENGGKSSNGSNVAISTRETIVKPALESPNPNSRCLGGGPCVRDRCWEGGLCFATDPCCGGLICKTRYDGHQICVRRTNAGKLSGRQRCQSCISGCKQYWSIGMTPNCCRKCNWAEEN